MNKDVSVKFFYYQLQVDRSIGESREKFLFDLTDFAILMKEMDIERRNWLYKGDTIRLKKFTMDENDLLLMQFERLTDSALPYIAKPSKDDERDVALSDDEFIANDINAIFDPKNHVLMLQRNIQSLSPKAVEYYVNHFWNIDRVEDPLEVIEFCPVINPNIFKEVKSNSKYKTLTFKTANKFDSKKKVRKIVVDRINGVLEGIISSFSPVDGLNLEIKVSTSRNKDDTLDNKTVKSIIDEIEKNPKSFDKAEVAVINDFDKKEVLNLLNALLFDTAKFNQSPRTRLRSDVVQDKMKSIYLPNKGFGENRKSLIDSILANK